MTHWLTENIFAITAILVIGSGMAIYHNSYAQRNFPYFTTEEQMEAFIEETFPLFAEYL